MSTEALTEALTELRDALASVRLPLALPDSEAAGKSARDMVTQLDDYILPRLATLDAPLLTVIGGSTGAGKSTLVNSLVGRVVSRPGVIRPTTKSPVLVHHPDDLDFFQSDRILPGLGRSFDQAHDTSTLQLVAEPSLPHGLALLDAPDIDSVVAENRALAAQLLAAADLWLFVTSAARYADAVPWEYLRAAADRAAAVAVVLDRVPPAAMGEVPPHLGRLMTERGLANSPLFAVPETSVDSQGLLPDAAVSPIRSWLATLAADQASRQAVVLQTLDGAIGSLVARSPEVAGAVDGQVEALAQLRTDAEKSYAEAVRTIGVQTADGTLLRGEVLARWQDFVGTGEFMRAVEQKIGWLRDKIWSTLKGEPPQANEVKLAVESGLEALVREEGDAAAERAEASWAANAAGRQVLQSAREDLSHSSPDFPGAVSRAIRDWQGDVLDIVSEVGQSKRNTARYLALGVNGLGVALMVVVFSQTGGITGAEVGVAGGTALLAQRLLEAVFGEDAVRRLAKQAKDRLDERVEALMADELNRFLRALAATGADAAIADAVRTASDALAEHRSGDPVLGRVERAELDPARRSLPAAEQPALTGEVLEPRDESEGYRVEVRDGA
ncbi:ABC transporter [Propioniciclava sinopodophylli]|uniref:ABC transporter n=1 Tax=Propioniciclava sinopodophylli TaxID=1837344 RepID=A0A4Q9KB10_9ACTN|nr:GTPase domain-containing protein [Propioniciclava sinopodophylli]TBT82798.1 ABC transporter [Propioniciclava sinopodophylli]